LFYDSSQKDKQEIIFVSPHDVKPLLDLEKAQHAAKSSALFNAVVLRHLIQLLTDDKNKDIA
jgi:hypothetical protein